MYYYFLLFPGLGGAIGWITNYIAIKFLFWPRKPMRIGGLVLQGVIPKRRKDLSRAVGEIVTTELLSREQIAAALNAPEIRAGMANLAGQAAGDRVAAYPLLLPLPRGVRQSIGEFVAGTVAKEVQEMLAGSGPELAEKILSSVNLAGLVEEKLDAMDWDYMERIVYSVAGRELKVIEVLGGVLGALVGLVQALVVYLLS